MSLNNNVGLEDPPCVFQQPGTLLQQEPTTQYFLLGPPPLQSGASAPTPLNSGVGGLGDGLLTLPAPALPAVPAVLGPKGG